jgi:iron complex transport system ATP-binding protein
MQLLHQLTRETGKTIFLSTHDLELALQIADKIWLMDRQHGITIGTPEDLALEGHLSGFFARKGIVFDMETGLFRVENQYSSQDTGINTLWCVRRYSVTVSWLTGTWNRACG